MLSLPRNMEVYSQYFNVIVAKTDFTHNVMALASVCKHVDTKTNTVVSLKSYL